MIAVGIVLAYAAAGEGEEEADGPSPTDSSTRPSRISTPAISMGVAMARIAREKATKDLRSIVCK